MSSQPITLSPVLQLDLACELGQFRAVPVSLGEGAPRAFLAVYGADFDIDPYVEMFFFPRDTLKMIVFDERGQILWRRDLGRGVVPGIWFCPVYVMDLDGDGIDEIWFVDNLNVDHPLGLSGYRLARVDAQTGALTGHWPWPGCPDSQKLSHAYRNFIAGGEVQGEPRLVTAQGTYGRMQLQGWRPDMTLAWESVVLADAPGARGSHMCAITDLDQDGVQEVMWGERCFALDDGREIFCADRDSYRGHSDIVTPVWDRAADRWYLWACRESDGQVAPRLCFYDQAGRRIWGDVDEGHMDMGWAAHLYPGRGPVAASIRIDHKTCGPDGRFHMGRTEFVYDALSGRKLQMPMSIYGALPVDLNGDGYHELVRGLPGQDGQVMLADGSQVGSVGGPVAILSHVLDRPGEQLMSFQADGTITLWTDTNAVDSELALARYRQPLYRANQRLTGVGYNLVNLGGI